MPKTLVGFYVGETLVSAINDQSKTLSEIQKKKEALEKIYREKVTVTFKFKEEKCHTN